MTEQTERNLRDRIEELEETVRQLKAERKGKVAIDFPREWRLTPQERDCLTVLYNTYPNLVSRESLTTRILQHKDTGEYNFASVIVAKLRKKIPKSIIVETVWGIGYHLTQHGHWQLDQLPKMEVL